MAASIAQATSRVAAAVCGGYALVGFPTDAFMRRMDRELRVPVASRTFWHWFKRFDWLEELARMPCPRLVYVGADDRTQARQMGRTREYLRDQGVDFIEFEGFDHRACAEPSVP